MAVDQRRIEHIPLDDITAAVRNPKRHDLTAVRASIERFGFASPALRDERTGRLVAGHGRVEALRQLRDHGASAPSGVRQDDEGRWLVPVVCGWSSRSDAEAEAYLVADNRHTELGGWDDAGLAELLETVREVDEDLLRVTGFDLSQLLAAQEVPDLSPFSDPAETAGSSSGSLVAGPSTDSPVSCPACGEVFDPAGA